MAPGDRQAAVVLIKKLKAEYCLTILLTEHDMDLVFGLAERIMVLNYGEVVAIGTPDEIKNDVNVRRLYLNESMHA